MPDEDVRYGAMNISYYLLVGKSFTFGQIASSVVYFNGFLETPIMVMRDYS